MAEKPGRGLLKLLELKSSSESWSCNGGYWKTNSYTLFCQDQSGKTSTIPALQISMEDKFLCEQSHNGNLGLVGKTSNLWFQVERMESSLYSILTPTDLKTNLTLARF